MAKIPSKINEDVDSIVSAYVDAPFDEGKGALGKRGYNLISLEENANLRIQEGEDSYVSRNGNWTREAIVYDATFNRWGRLLL